VVTKNKQGPQPKRSQAENMKKRKDRTDRITPDHSKKARLKRETMGGKITKKKRKYSEGEKKSTRDKWDGNPVEWGGQREK